MILTTDNLPAYGVLRGYLTATAVEFAESGEYTDEHGWVSERWSLRELYPSRNDVEPYAEWRVGHDDATVGGCWLELGEGDAREDAAFVIRYALNEFFGTTGYEDNGDGTFYGADAIVTDYTDPRSYAYALHFHVKHCDPVRGWVEDSVVIA